MSKAASYGFNWKRAISKQMVYTIYLRLPYLPLHHFEMYSLLSC